jgi:hypothetical protein
MVQSIMYIGMGFLLAAIIAVAVMPAVHDRAVRITTRRLRAILPESAEEIHAQNPRGSKNKPKAPEVEALEGRGAAAGIHSLTEPSRCLT